MTDDHPAYPPPVDRLYRLPEPDPSMRTQNWPNYRAVPDGPARG